jgi:transcriptional regulator with XRE-family HTH domain
MPAGNSLNQRKPGRFAREKKEFGALVQELKRLTAKQRYTKKQIASELDVSLVAVSQWWSGYTLTGKRETIEKLKKYFNLDSSGIMRAVHSGNKLSVALAQSAGDQAWHPIPVW